MGQYQLLYSVCSVCVLAGAEQTFFFKFLTKFKLNQNFNVI